MRPLLLIHHEAGDTMGIAPGVLRANGVPVEVLAAWRQDVPSDPAPWSGLVVFGGSMNVDTVREHPFLAGERELVARALDAGTPVLGVCLGAQLMARALGAGVTRAPSRVLGFSDVVPTDEGRRDPVLCALGDGRPMFHWHEDAFDLPPGATLLATGRDGSVQAFRASARAWGVVFHPEVTEDELRAWADAAGDQELESTWGSTREALLQEIRRELPRQRPVGEALFAGFAEVAARSDA